MTRAGENLTTLQKRDNVDFAAVAINTDDGVSIVFVP
jgi:hypothetical protein